MGIQRSGYTKSSGTSELGSVARTSGNAPGGFDGGVQARNAGAGAGSATYYDASIGGVAAGGVQFVRNADGSVEARIGRTPAGDPAVDRRVYDAIVRGDGIVTAPGFLPSDTGGGIGTYAFCYRLTNATLAFGATVAGSDLKPTQAGNNSSGGSALTGTWRCLGQSNNSASDSDRKTMYVRIS